MVWGSPGLGPLLPHGARFLPAAVRPLTVDPAAVTNTAVHTPAALRVAVRPPRPFRLRGGSMDGLFRRRGGAVQRLVHVGEERVFVGAVQAADETVVLAARAATPEAAAAGLRRMRFA